MEREKCAAGSDKQLGQEQQETIESWRQDLGEEGRETKGAIQRVMLHQRYVIALAQHL